MMLYLNEAKNLYDKFYLQEPNPSTEEQVSQMEQKLNLRFPLAYREYLLWMGQGAAGMGRGEDFGLSSLPWL